MKILSPRVHGFIDYAIVALLVLAPTLFAFGGIAATICYVVAAFHLVMSLLTAYPLGVAKLIPFPVHGGIELAAGIALIVMPWIVGFSAVDNARNFFVIAGIATAAVWLTTNYSVARATIEEPVGTRRY
jgi:hypothetical protein